MNEPFQVEKVVKIHTGPLPGLEEENHGGVPNAIRITHPFAFYGEDGHLYKWAANCVITDVAEIEELIERGIRYEVIEDDH